MTREEIVKEARQLPLTEERRRPTRLANSIQAEIEANGSVMTHEGNLEEKLAAFHRLALRDVENRTILRQQMRS